MMYTRPEIPSSFHSDGHERQCLDELIRYFVVTDGVESDEAKQSLSRLHQLLSKAGEDDGSIILQDQWALYCELLNDWQTAISHRRREIVLINNLFELGGPVGPINEGFLSRVRDALESDLRQIGGTATNWKDGATNRASGH